MDFTKIIHIGSNNFCKITFTNEKLSISGVQKPYASGNCGGSCGQIQDTLAEEKDSIQFAPGWEMKTLEKFLTIWNRWHLNNLTPGTPEQMEYLRKNRKEKSSYEKNCNLLKEAGLYTVQLNGQPYNYGHKWLMEEVPQAVLAFLQELPNTDKTPAWI